jgi:3-oxoacyl-[acyl-carrier protein] reductase
MRRIEQKEGSMLLEKKVAIVTGAGRGIGRAIALRLAQEGAILVICDVEEENIGAVCKELKDSGKQGFPFPCDVSNKDNVQAMVETTVKQFGKIDILVNNAGISPKKEGRKPNLTEISLEEWNRVIAVNLTSVFLCCKTVLPYFIKQKAGWIISISSSSALDGGLLAAAHYVASKGGISAMTKSLAREVAPFGINVNAIAPGRVESPMALLTSPERNMEALKRIPAGRFGTPEDVANAALFLVSGQAQYITGITLNVSGGYVMF